MARKAKHTVTLENTALSIDSPLPDPRISASSGWPVASLLYHGHLYRPEGAKGEVI